jgi:hypothetical protein
MTNKERARAGGKARGWEERKRALEIYNMEPHFCRSCGQPIEVGDRRVTDVMKKKFCDSTCAARFNNAVRYNNRDLTQAQPAG